MADTKPTPPRPVMQAARAVELLDGFALHGPPRRGEEPGWWLPVCVTGLLPSRKRAQNPKPTEIGDQELVTFFFSDATIEGAPTPFLRADFPEQIIHFTDGAGGIGPVPCLTHESLSDFHYEHGFVGILHQLRAWLLKAATGKLANREDGWEATPTPSATCLVSSHSALRTVNDPVRKNGACAYIIYKVDAFKPGASFRYDLTVCETFNPSDRRPASGFVAGIHFHTADDATPISSHINPAAVRSAGDLAHLAQEIGITEMDFVAALTTVISETIVSRRDELTDDEIVVPVSLLIPRPFDIAGTDSPLELFVFGIAWKVHWDVARAATQFEEADVHVGRLLSDASADTRLRLSGYASSHTFDLAGAGSVGSKIGLSLCRAGWICQAVYDPDVLLPHNVARHGLHYPADARLPKTLAFANAVRGIQKDPIREGDDILSLSPAGENETVGPAFLINATADNRVSDGLAGKQIDELPSRIIDASLMLRGRVGLLIIEGAERSPNYHDLMAQAMRNVAFIDGLGGALLTDMGGYDRIDVGGGCGAFTMVVSDARLSALSGMMAEEILNFGETSLSEEGHAILWHSEAGEGSIHRTSISSKPFSVIQCEESEWTVRISPDVVAAMESAQGAASGRETGGYLLGHVSERRREIVVVGLVPPPPDSTSSSTQITLGTQGVKEAVSAIFSASAGYLWDVGTWHSHLSDTPPSPTDLELVEDLSLEPSRLAPSVMIVCTPQRMHAVLADPAAASGAEIDVA